MEEILFTKEDCPNCTVHAPEQAYLYFPSFEKQIIYDENNPKKSCRIIFEKKNKNDYLPHENEYYEKFMEYINDKYKDDITIPKDWTEGEIRKFLQAADFDFEDAIAQIKERLNMHIPAYPFDNIIEILSSGFVYMHGLDNNYRPIIVCSLSRFMEYIDQYELDYFICAINVFSNYLLKHLFIPGQVENWIIITDLNGVSLWKPPTKMISIFNFLQKRFYYRLAKLYVYGMSGILNFCWRIIKNLVNDKTKEKFIFISNESDIHSTIINHVHPSQLEEKYGGTSPNIVTPLTFPFFLPSEKYQVDDSNKDQIITKENYMSLIEKDKLLVVSPYIEQKIKIDTNLTQNLQKSLLLKAKNSINIVNNSSTINSNECVIIWNNMEFYEIESNLDNDISNNNNFYEKDLDMKPENFEENKNMDNTVLEANERNIDYCQCSCACIIF
jgi:hypothetical protein